LKENLFASAQVSQESPPLFFSSILVPVLQLYIAI